MGGQAWEGNAGEGKDTLRAMIGGQSGEGVGRICPHEPMMFCPEPAKQRNQKVMKRGNKARANKSHSSTK